MKHAAIRAIEYYLPERVVSTAELASEFPEWSVEKIDKKTGIQQRHIAAADECSSDMAVAAAERLFASGACGAADIDFILLCTQSPDYFLPTTACLVQDRLGIPTQSGAFDFNLGCSGYIYGLGLAEGLIATNQAENVLLLTSETYSKFLHRRDKSVRTIFGDAAAATLVSAVERDQPAIGPFLYGTDGRGRPNLIVPAGATRKPHSPETAQEREDESGNIRTDDNLFMDGAEIFNFTLETVPQAVEALLQKAGMSDEDVDLFVFHQANRYMLEHLRKRIHIPEEKFPVSMAHCGNTVSSTIPIVLKDLQDKNCLRPGMTLMLVGFGVGYSWGGTLVRW